MQKNDEFAISCSTCMTVIVTTYSKLAADNQMVCPECFSLNVIDVEDLKRKRQIIIDRVHGKRPEKNVSN